ncbi:MAG: M20/M25/M40 family metallo-hydrolase [Acidimicrobiia bacterium]|nr:M20/M25/M40 family metallo-hydrolase [Acidimicrobiia bacterium]
MKKLTLLLPALATVFAQDAASLLREASVRAAIEFAAQNEDKVIAEQIEICEVPAPPFHEKQRGELYKRKFEELGLRNVRIDAEGNVIGGRPGRNARPNLVFSAHLDTVFPPGTNVKVTRDGSWLKGPGIGDDCRGLAVVLGVIRAMNAAKVETPGTITFVGTVGEEGLGDLRGVKHLFGSSLKGQIDKFISLDGIGFGVANVGVGSFRYKVTFKGPGGHSYGAFGMANPIHALGRAIEKISDFQVPSMPKTTFNVGRIGGGTSVNSIAFEAWMEVDMRSADPASLREVDEKFKAAVQQALDEENARWNQNGRIAVQIETVGVRPAGKTSEDSAIVRTAVAVSSALGLQVTLREGSTDSNVGMNLGVPSITMNSGGAGRGAHSLGEMFDTTDSYKGTQRALLAAIALAR